MLKRILTILAGAALSAAGLAQGPPYQVHSDGKFSASFPTNLPYKVTRDKQQMVGYSAGSMDMTTKPFFSVLHFPEQKDGLEGLIEFTKNTSHGLTLSRRVLVDGVKGAEFTGAAEGLPMTMRIFATPSGAWNVCGRSIDPIENGRFVESFHFRK